MPKTPGLPIGDVSQHAVNLENFEEHEGQRIASPTSVAIMNMYGVLQQVKCLRAYHLVHDVCVCVRARMRACSHNGSTLLTLRKRCRTS